MAITITKVSQSQVISSLDTYNHTVVTAGLHLVKVLMTERPPSAVSIAISQQASLKITSTAPAATQDHIEVQILLNCAASDVLAIAITSATAAEGAPNIVKGIITINRIS